MDVLNVGDLKAVMELTSSLGNAAELTGGMVISTR